MGRSRLDDPTANRAGADNPLDKTEGDAAFESVITLLAGNLPRVGGCGVGGGHRPG